MGTGEGLVVYVNGAFLADDEAAISVFDHGFLYGDGVYDTMCAWGGSIFKLEAHLERLYRSAHAAALAIPLSREELREAVIETVRKCGLREAYIKCVVTRGVSAEPLLDPRGCRPSIVIFSRRYLVIVDPAKEERGVRLKIASVRRTPSQCLDGRIKNLNYLNLILAKVEALGAGTDDALLLSLDGRVLEGPGFNVFLVADGVLRTPPSEDILLGITRETVLEIAEREGIPCREEPIWPYDLYNAAEVFCTSTAGGIIPAVAVDGRVIGDGRPGLVTRAVGDAYLQMLQKGEHGTPVF